MPIRLASASALAAVALLAAAPSASAAEAVLLARTPLVLKDGRIAHVTVHTIGFPLGKDEPDDLARDALGALVDELATDCFLTAQAVGHVEPGPGSGVFSAQLHRAATHRSGFDRQARQSRVRVQRHLHRAGRRRGGQASGLLLPQALRDPANAAAIHVAHPFTQRDGREQPGAGAERRPQHNFPSAQIVVVAHAKSSYGRILDAVKLTLSRLTRMDFWSKATA